MKNAWPLAIAPVAIFTPKSAFAQTANTMKPPNERFVLNALQAMIVVQAAAAKAAANKYVLLRCLASVR
jgi:hypothetical protein